MSTTHGLSNHPLYRTHRSMMTRCYNPNSKSYKGYGDRGITVCAEWHDVAVLITWIGENLGPRPEGMSLDRWPDKDGPYALGNVRWTDPKKQQRNTRSNRQLTLDGVTKCMAEWVEDLGIPRDTIRDRLKRGWPAERALTMPSQGRAARLLTLNGITKSLAEWSRDLGLPRTTIHERLSRGWPVEEALTTPAGGRRKIPNSAYDVLARVGRRLTGAGEDPDPRKHAEIELDLLKIWTPTDLKVAVAIASGRLTRRSGTTRKTGGLVCAVCGTEEPDELPGILTPILGDQEDASA